MPAYLYKTVITDESSSLYMCYYYGVKTLKPGKDPRDDNYFGSSTIIKNYIQKHGESKIHKTVLAIADIEFAYFLERQLVNNELLKDPLCINRQVGGSGGRSPLYTKPERDISYKGQQGKTIYNDGVRHYYLAEDDPRKEVLTKGKLPVREETKQKLRRKRKPFVRSDVHKNNMAKAYHNKSLGFLIHTPWGVYENYLVAIENMPADFTLHGNTITKESLKYMTRNSNRKPRHRDETYAQLGFYTSPLDLVQ